MYAYIMTRTQIYLSEEETRALQREARASGRSKSQLIREAIDRVYLQANDSSKLIRALGASAGAWKRRTGNGEAYVERVRGGRLARLHAEAGK
jgi:predicted transcriptional regulator